MTQKLVNFEVKSRVSVSPGEVNDYYKAHSSDFAQGDRVNLQHILIRTSTRSEDEAKQLAESIEQVEHNVAPHRKAVLASKFGPALRRHVEELRKARMTYGPVRLGKV